MINRRDARRISGPLRRRPSTGSSERKCKSSIKHLLFLCCPGLLRAQVYHHHEGRVGLAPANCQLDDVICVFLGACVPHVLRANDAHAEATTFSFVGDGYLHGIMNSEALVILEKKELERREFIIT